MKNSFSYSATLTSRRRTVLHFLYMAGIIDSSYGKFLAYLLLSNLNLLAPKEERITLPFIEPDIDRNFNAWYKEVSPITYAFRIRRQFVPFFREMIAECELLLEETDITIRERAAILSFMGLIGLYCKGKLLPGVTVDEFNYLRSLTK